MLEFSACTFPKEQFFTDNWHKFQKYHKIRMLTEILIMIKYKSRTQLSGSKYYGYFKA